jgi:hypothetical protein
MTGRLSRNLDLAYISLGRSEIVGIPGFVGYPNNPAIFLKKLLYYLIKSSSNWNKFFV